MGTAITILCVASVVHAAAAGSRSSFRSAEPPAQSAAGQASAPSSAAPALRNGDVIDLLKGGLSAETVVVAINTADRTAFDTAPPTLIQLKSQGVPDSVIGAMLQRAAKDRQSAATAPPATAQATAPGALRADLVQPQLKQLEDRLAALKRQRLDKAAEHQRALESARVSRSQCNPQTKLGSVHCATADLSDMVASRRQGEVAALDAGIADLQRKVDAIHQAAPGSEALSALGSTPPASAAGNAVAAAPAAVPVAWALIPAGTFEMGCAPTDKRCSPDEKPRHSVTLSKPFELMTTEATMATMRQFAGETGLAMPVQEWATMAQQPAVGLTWDEARSLCRWLGGRLPTEAEWERAARGGTDAAVYPWGAEPPIDHQGAKNGAHFGKSAPAPVATYAPNGYGLFDMSGNVFEWTSDAYGDFKADAVVDPSPQKGGKRVVKGGAFVDTSTSELRTSYRWWVGPEKRYIMLGVRCARDPVAK
jgi:formylglycine-generating enzyme required for sulfatase activity